MKSPLLILERLINLHSHPAQDGIVRRNTDRCTNFRCRVNPLGVARAMQSAMVGAVAHRPKRRIKAAFQGERGAYSEDAARALIGEQVEPVPHRSFEAMFEAVARGEADCAAVPIENSLAGSVYKNYDLLLEHDLTIAGEVNVRIAHNLIAPPGVALQAVRRVYSHPVALAQCEKFLQAHPAIEALPAYDTAGSVKLVMERRRPDEAAIAGRSAAAVHGAQILCPGIESHPQNFTRFLLLVRPDRASKVGVQERAAGRKTSVVFQLKNQPGALFKALAVFALRDIDLSKLESRPILGRPWEYSFYLDLIGDTADPPVERALSNLAEVSESVRVLGCYPRGATIHTPRAMLTRPTAASIAAAKRVRRRAEN